jgi:ABC-type Fe3+/spermidine/putrescine transport system ATPase subunit
MIELEGFSVRRDDTIVVDDVSLSVGAEVVAVVGPSGSGKSTLLRGLLGLELPTKGLLRIGGRVMSRDGSEHVLPEARNVAMVFQDLALWPHLSVHGNLAFGLRARGLGKAACEKRIAEALASVGMADKAARRPHALSGGERQRVAIARALVLEPDALLLDEPLGSLDVVMKDELLALFAKLFAERGLSVLYVTHDPREATRLGHRIVVIEAGRIVQQGTLAELERAPATPFVRAFVRASRGSAP